MAIRIEIELSEAEAQALERIAHEQGKQPSTLLKEWLLSQLVHVRSNQAENQPCSMAPATTHHEIQMVPIASDLYRVQLLVNGQPVVGNPLSVAGRYRSGYTDIAAHHDSYLEEIFGTW